MSAECKPKKPYRNLCRSNRVVFDLQFSEKKKGDIECQLFQWNVEKKLCYGLIAINSDGSLIQGIIHMKSSFLSSDDGGVVKWKKLVPGLAGATIKNAGKKTTDQYWKESLLERGATLVKEFGEATDVKYTGNIQAHLARIAASKSMDEIQEADPNLYIKHYHNLVSIVQKNQAKEYKGIIVDRLNCWQKIVLDKLMTQDNRKILFVVDSKGNRGKSFLAIYMKQKYPETHQTINAKMKESDATFILSQNPNIQTVIFDYARNTMPQKFHWDLFEHLKDGSISSGKYKSKTVCFKGSVKLAVFTNHDPSHEFYQLSDDRIEVVNLDDLYALHGEQAMSDLIEEDKEENV